MSRRHRRGNGLPPTVTEDYYKSSFSGSAGCVEVRISTIKHSVQVRDSKDPTGPELTFTPLEWAAFLAAVKSGEFEIPDQWRRSIPADLVDLAARL
jgi:Domain of unknown function (DUF397)